MGDTFLPEVEAVLGLNPNPVKFWEKAMTKDR